MATPYLKKDPIEKRSDWEKIRLRKDPIENCFNWDKSRLRIWSFLNRIFFQIRGRHHQLDDSLVGQITTTWSLRDHVGTSSSRFDTWLSLSSCVICTPNVLNWSAITWAPDQSPPNPRDNDHLWWWSEDQKPAFWCLQRGCQNQGIQKNHGEETNNDRAVLQCFSQ